MNNNFVYFLLKDFGHISNKHELPSGQTSLQISRMPSDEDLCLSPPWVEEDDGLVRVSMFHLVHKSGAQLTLHPDFLCLARLYTFIILYMYHFILLSA